MLRLLISTGEVSGDLQGSLLVKALLSQAKQRGLSLKIYALGGPRMEAEGAKLIADTSPLGAIGLWEAIPFIFPTLSVQKRVNDLLKLFQPDGVVLIDYMGPNIRLGNKLRKKFPGIPITYYIAPQEWAWHVGDGGTTDLIQFTDKILAIFPDEAAYYKNKGGDVTWVGHPMLDITESLPDIVLAREKLSLDNDEKMLLLLPASRKQELRYLMPPLVKAASLLQKRFPKLRVFIPAGLESFEEPIKRYLEKEGVKGTVISASESNAMKPFLFAAADLALSKSGTVNMELALHNVPQIVGYKVSRITAFVAKYLLRFHVKHISPVNLILDECLVPELVQDSFKSNLIVDIAERILTDKSTRDNFTDGYSRLRDRLGSPGVTERAASSILNSLL